MKRIILHWTAGSYQPNHTDFEHYHYLVNGQGLVIEGKYKPEDNLTVQTENMHSIQAVEIPAQLVFLCVVC